MTQNQLRYWELRWKQYYEFYYLKELERSNLAKEKETKRHNVAQEKIAKQELVLRRIELSQNQQKIVQQWENLRITEQANIVKAALDLRNQDRLANEFLSSQKMAAASMIVQYNNEQEKRQIEKFSAYANAVDKGWKAITVVKILTEIESSNDDVNALLTNVAKQYNLDVEVKGPQGILSKVNTAAKENRGENLGFTDEHGVVKPEFKKDPAKRKIIDQIAKEGLSYSDVIEKYGPNLEKVNSQNKTNSNSVAGGVVISNGNKPSVTKAPTTSTSGVIYSKGAYKDVMSPLMESKS